MSDSNAAGGQPTRRQLKAQAAIDSGAALVLAMLAWPFPLARALLPLPVNIACVIVFWQLVQVLYFVVTAGIWGQTGGMRLQGLRVIAQDGAPPSRASRIKWGALAGATALKHALVRATPDSLSSAERIAGVRIRTL